MESQITIKGIKKKLLTVNRKGATMTISRGGEQFIDTVLDTLIPVRAEKDAWWLSWRPIWFTEGQQYIHVVKVVKTEIEDSHVDPRDGEQWAFFNLTDDNDNVMHIELILPELDKKAHDAWKSWQKHRNEQADMFKAIDKAVERSHTRIANEW